MFNHFNKMQSHNKLVFDIVVFDIISFEYNYVAQVHVGSAWRGPLQGTSNTHGLRSCLLQYT